MHIFFIPFPRIFQGGMLLDFPSISRGLQLKKKVFMAKNGSKMHNFSAFFQIFPGAHASVSVVKISSRYFMPYCLQTMKYIMIISWTKDVARDGEGDETPTGI